MWILSIWQVIYNQMCLKNNKYVIILAHQHLLFFDKLKYNFQYIMKILYFKIINGIETKLNFDDQ